MKMSRTVTAFLLLLMVAGAVTSCRPRATRSRNTNRNQTQQQASQGTATGTTSAAQVMAKSDSVLSRIGAMYNESTDIPPIAMEPMMGIPRTPWGTPYVPRPQNNDYDLYEGALGAFNGGDYDRAIGLLSQIAVSGRPPELVPSAYYWMGESYYAMGRYQESLPYFEYTTKVGPQHKREIALYKLSRANRELGNKQAASLWYNRLRVEYPKTSYASRLRALGVS